MARREVRNITYMHLGRKLWDLAAFCLAKEEKWQKNSWSPFFGPICDRKLQIYIKLNYFNSNKPFSQEVPRGLMARIAGFHPAGPGSIPGVGELFFFLFEEQSRKKK